MTRIPQPPGERGSLKWIQRAVNERWARLNDPILAALPDAQKVRWLSPLAPHFYEYRDEDFLSLLGCEHLVLELQAFWPARGPQWDALGKTDGGHLLLVEAKARVKEMCSPGSAAGPSSRSQIMERLDQLAIKLGARADRGAWVDHFYQLANRLAHLDFLRSHGREAYLVLVNFVGDAEMKGPSSAEAWKAAYEVAFHVMGLRKNHPLARYVIEVFPDVREATPPDPCAPAALL